MACRNPVLPPLSTTSTPTLIATSTPICGFTPLPNTNNGLIQGPYYVIKDQIDFTNINDVSLIRGASVSLPSIDFSTQMVLEYSQEIQTTCFCTVTLPAITSVCDYTDHIEVDYQNGGASCVVPVNGSNCNFIMYGYYQAMVTLPQSNLPVSWVGH
jgi:hypothetical protein